MSFPLGMQLHLSFLYCGLREELHPRLLLLSTFGAPACPRRGQISNNRGCNLPACASRQAQWNPRLAEENGNCVPEGGEYISISGSTPVGAGGTLQPSSRGFREKLHPRLLLLSTFGAPEKEAGQALRSVQRINDFDGVALLLVVPELFVEGRRRCPKGSLPRRTFVTGDEVKKDSRIHGFNNPNF